MRGSDALRAMDDALVRLRRLWSATHTRPTARENPPVEMSSVLVVEACARAATRGHQATVGEVAEFADVEHSTATRLVDRAVRSGLVVRARSAEDARRTVVRLTPAGHDLQREASAFRLDWLAGVLADWESDDVATFAALLARFADQVGDTGPWSPPAAPPGRPT